MKGRGIIGNMAILIMAGIAILLLIGIAGATAPIEKWNKTYGGINYDQAFFVQQTLDGGYVFSGYTSGIGYSDGWLTKTDSHGNELWNKIYGGNGSDYVRSSQLTSDGGYILAGQTSSYGSGYDDVWLIKTDSFGNEQWNKTFGGNNSDQAFSVQQTLDGGYILAGVTQSFGAGNRDVWLIKTDSSGNQQWNRVFGGAYYDEAYSVQQTLDGGYILAGITNLYGASDYNAWLIKTDSSGNQQWNKTFGGIDADCAYSVLQTLDGGYVFVGYTASYGWLVKTDSLGNKQWNKIFGEADFNVIYSVLQNLDSEYTLIGYTNSYGSSYDDIDAWLVKTDSFGNEQWNKTFGGNNYDEAKSVQQTLDGGYILAGMTESFGAGGRDAWLVKISSDKLVLTPNEPIDLTQFKSDGNTPIVVGNITNERTVVFKGRVSDPEGGNVRLQVELRRTDEYGGEFNESKGGLKTSELVANGSIAAVSAIELINGNYHWRARTVDANGNKSEWQDYGGNNVSDPDFEVKIFNLAHMTDVHYGGITIDRFTDTLQAIKTNNPEIILSSGDIADYSDPLLYQSYTGILKSLSQPVYNMPGNHDSRASLGGLLQEIGLGNYNNNINNPSSIISLNDGLNGYYLDINGVRIIVLDSGRDFNVAETSLTPESNGLTDTQFNRLKEVSSAFAGPKIIVMHHPVIDESDDGEVVNNCPQYGGNNNAIAFNRCGLISYSLEENNNILSILGGHTHQDFAKYWLTTDTQRFVGFIQTRSATKDVSGYSILEIKDSAITLTRRATDSVLSPADRAGYLFTFQNVQGRCYVEKNSKITGTKYLNDVREIPNTYYTGRLESGEQAIAYYSKDNGEPDKFQCNKNVLIAGVSTRSVSANSLNQSANNITIKHRTENMNIEYVYDNVSFGAGENASLGINFSTAGNYTMEFDNDGDGTVDNTAETADITINHAPEISITSPIGTQSGNISIAYNLKDNESANASILAEYSIDNSTWIEATMGAGGDGVINITSSAEGVSHTYIWQSSIDIPAGGGNVTFRLKPIEEEIAGEFATTNSFLVLAPLRYINGTVTDSISNTGVIGATVFASNTSTTTNTTGFYSLAVPEGEYNLTVRLDPTYYPSVMEVSTVEIPAVVQDIELVKKPTGTISGSVSIWQVIQKIIGG